MHVVLVDTKIKYLQQVQKHSFAFSTIFHDQGKLSMYSFIIMSYFILKLKSDLGQLNLY